MYNREGVALPKVGWRNRGYQRLPLRSMEVTMEGAFVLKNIKLHKVGLPRCNYHFQINVRDYHGI